MKSIQIQNRKFKDNRPGDFALSNINYEEQTAIANFSKEVSSLIDISNFIDEVKKKDKSDKKLFVRIT